MTKRKTRKIKKNKFEMRNWIIAGLLALIVMGGGIAAASEIADFNIRIFFDVSEGLEAMLGGERMGGTTADDWNVGGNLDVTGTGTIDGASTLTGAITAGSTLGVSGATTLSSTLTVSGETNLDNLIYGGDRTAIAYATNTVITAANLCNSSVLYTGSNIDTGVETTELIIASSSDLIADCIPTSGDTKEVLLENEATSTFAITLKIPPATTAINGGLIKLMEPSGGDVVIQQNEEALIRMVNNGGSTTTVTVTSIQEAD